MKLAIITAGGANFYSIEVVLQRLGVEYELTTDKRVIAAADGIIFPGVGAAGYAMAELARHDLIETIRNYKKPLLGICLAMQLLYEYSAEGEVACLGTFPGRVERFIPAPDFTVPHIGWNNLSCQQESPLLRGIDLSQDVYFVHSFYAPVNQVTVASCDYGLPFAAIAQRDNFYAMQFHPEKSGAIGEQLIKNFIEVVNDNLSSN